MVGVWSPTLTPALPAEGSAYTSGLQPWPQLAGFGNEERFLRSDSASPRGLSLAQPWLQALSQPPPLPNNGTHLVLSQGLPTQSPASSMGQDSVSVGPTLARCLVRVGVQWVPDERESGEHSAGMKNSWVLPAIPRAS